MFAYFLRCFLHLTTTMKYHQPSTLLLVETHRKVTTLYLYIMTTKLCLSVIHYVYNLARTIQNYSDKNLQRKYTYLHHLIALAAEMNGTNPTM